MIILAALLAGAALGWRRATRAKGNRADRIQWALAHALAFGALGLMVTVIIDRLI